jgi:hypothetical protein
MKSYAAEVDEALDVADEERFRFRRLSHRLLLLKIRQGPKKERVLFWYFDPFVKQFL